MSSFGVIVIFVAPILLAALWFLVEVEVGYVTEVVRSGQTLSLAKWLLCEGVDIHGHGSVMRI